MYIYVGLIKHKANIEAVNFNGETALHLAAEKGSKIIVKMLLDKVFICTYFVLY
jgi:ankyrin repeat protein